MLVPAIRYTISFTATGTIDSFDTAGVKASLRAYLQCFEPDCTVELQVTQGSVNVEAVVTDTRGDGSSTATVEAAAALSQESEAGLTNALGVTVQGAVTVSAPSNVMAKVKPDGPDTMDAGITDSDEGLGGLIAGATVGCLALVAALGAGGFYCYKKKTPPPRPANVEIMVPSPPPPPANVAITVSSPASNNDAARGAVTPAAQKEEAPAQAVLPPAISQPVFASASGEKTLTAVLASCGLEHRAKLFEDQNYTLELAFRALDSGEKNLMTDLRDLNLTLGECRKLITKLKHAQGASPNVWL